MADIQICLPPERASEIQDALYFLRGQYAIQDPINTDDLSEPNYNVLEWFSEQLDLAIECGGTAMSCDDIQDCIETTPALQVTINNVVNTSTTQSTAARITTRTLPIYNRPVEPVAACNNDNLFAMVTAFEDAVHGDVLDFFELIEVSTNVVEAIEQVSEQFGISELTLGIPNALTSAFNYIQENLRENYDAQYDDERRDKLRCDVFCAVKDTCQFSAADYLLALAGVPPTITEIIDSVSIDYAELLDFLIDVADGEYDAQDVVEFMHAFIVVMAFMFDIGFGFPTFVKRGQMGRYYQQIDAARDEVDNDWTTLCEDCNEIDKTVTFDAGGWAYTIRQGSITVNGNPNNGLLSVLVGSSYDASIYVDFQEDVNTISFDVLSLGSGNIIVLNGAESILYALVGHTGFSTWETVTVTMNATVNGSLAIIYQSQNVGLTIDNVRGALV